MKKSQRILVTILIILSMGYTAYEMVEFVQKRKEAKKFSEYDRQKMIAKIIESSRSLSSMEYGEAYKISDCMVDELVERYTPDEIWEMDRLGKTNRAALDEKMLPIVEKCFIPYIKTDSLSLRDSI